MSRFIYDERVDGFVTPEQYYHDDEVEVDENFDWVFGLDSEEEDEDCSDSYYKDFYG